nr:hypothetical protein [Tanacetum cinerariifolium]
MASLVVEGLVEGAELLGIGAEELATEEVVVGAEELATEEVVVGAEELATEEAVVGEVTVESEEGLEATINAEEEAVEAAEKAAEAEVGLGARIAKAVGETIVAALKGVLKLLKELAKNAGELLLLKMAIDQVPTEQRKALAGIAMMLAAGGNQLALVAYAYISLSGGSEEGKKVAKEAKQVVNELHEHARNLKVDTPSKVPIDKETHEAVMKTIKQQADSDKKDMEKIRAALEPVKNVLKEHADNKPEARIETGLKAALGLLKAKSGDLLLLYVALEQIPTRYRKAWTREKKVAKAAQEITDELHEKARKLTEDSPASKVLINKETHEPLMEKMYQHADSTKQEMGKMTDILEGLDHLVKELKGGEARDNHPHEGEEKN